MSSTLDPVRIFMDFFSIKSSDHEIQSFYTYIHQEILEIDVNQNDFVPTSRIKGDKYWVGVLRINIKICLKRKSIPNKLI